MVRVYWSSALGGPVTVPAAVVVLGDRAEPRGEADDPAGRLRSAQVGEQRPRQHERPDRVHLEVLDELLPGQLFDTTVRPADPGVVDQDIHRLASEPV
jgi:hypothetical protein